MSIALVGFGRYRIERALGQGGMGAVHEVLDLASERRVALKRLHQSDNAKQAALFEREYRTLASLRHPRIVQVFEYGVDDLGRYYTMELLEGSDLSARAPLGWREVCACLRDTASILSLLHARRLIHRDLSPRNLWLTADAHVKLLDFGALASFGPCDDVIGTPAFVAPEALAGRPLDQRTDLYALGALGYWLLTGSHAYHATQLGELQGLWQQTLVPVTQRAQRLHGSAREIPPALEQLIAALLRQDADERPQRAADVVDQLNGIAGLAPEAEHIVVRAYLDSGLLVAREHERKLLAQQLTAAAKNRPCALLFEAERGYGRTRLLSDLALDARTHGALVVRASALENERPYALAIELISGLLAALPIAAEQAAKPHASVLGSLSAALRQRLGQPPLPAPRDAASERMRKQLALSELFLTLARQYTLALFIDDLHDADEASQALLAALARATEGRLLIVATSRVCEPQQPSAAEQSYRTVALCIRIAQLMHVEVHALLRSIFGDVPYLERYAARIHASSGGSPAVCMQLVNELVRTGVARYADGSWSLPAEVPDPLPCSPQAAEPADLVELPAHLRELSRVLSLADHGAFPRELLPSTMSADQTTLSLALEQLIERGLVREDRDRGLRISRSALRQQLSGELDRAQATRVHGALSRHLSAASDVLSQARAALHALRAGELRRAEPQLLAVCRRILAGEHETLHASAPILECALELLPAGRPQRDVRLVILCVLAVAGYQVDRRYAARWGDAAVQALWQTLRFSVAERLRPVIGSQGALAAALTSASVALVLRRSKLRLFELISFWVATLGYSMGPATLSLDAPRLRRYASLLQPLLALGSDHGVACVYRFAQGLAAAIEDRLGEAHTLQAQVIERLSRPGTVPGMTELNRRNLLSAALYNAAIRYSWACDPKALEIADELDGTTPMNEIQAEHVRALYYAHRGDPRVSAQAIGRMELKAIQLGTAWQAELLTPRHELRLSVFTRDLASSKRAARTLARLIVELPTLAQCERRARARDALLRGRYEKAVELLEPDEPAAVSGPIFLRCLLAEAYNALGRYDDAKRVCLDELSRFSDIDRSFVIANLPIELELSRAQAGLSDHAAAGQRLDQLLAEHKERGPLVLGRLHDARARIALQVGEHELAEHHCVALEAQFGPTRATSLLAQSRALRQALTQARAGDLSQVDAAPADDLLSHIDALMLSSSSDLTHRVRAALQVAVERTGGELGFILRAGDADAYVWIGVPPSAEVLTWARLRLDQLSDPDEETVAVSLRPEGWCADVERFQSVEHQLIAIWQHDSLVHKPLAVLVIGGWTIRLESHAITVLRQIGERLIRS